MKKIALLLALLMIVGCFAACGGDSEKNQTTEPAAATGGAANQPTATNNAGVADPEICPDSADGKHQYTEEVAGEPSCTLPGLMMYTCSACQFSTTIETIEAINQYATGGLQPDATIMVYIDYEEGLRRKKQQNGSLDRMEAQQDIFHRRVNEGYLQLAHRYPERIQLVDGARDPQTIHQDILKRLH